MKKQFISLLLALAVLFAFSIPAMAEETVSADPFEEITEEFIQAKVVVPYEISVRPARITGWAALRWAPSYRAPMIETFTAKQILTILRETPHWLLAENLETGDIGYISRDDVAESREIGTLSQMDVSETENGKTNLGVVDANGAFTLECTLPEGYHIETGYSSGDEMYALILSEDAAKPGMRLSVGFDPAYAEVDRLNDLDRAALTKLEETFIRNDPAVEITYGETNLGTRLLIAKMTNGDKYYMDFMTIYKGYFVECVLLPSRQAENNELTEDQVRMCVDFLTDLDFVDENDEEDDEIQPDAGEKYIARLTDYNSEDNTVFVEVLDRLVIEREQADNLKEGDTLTIADETITVEKTEKSDTGIFVNDQYFLEYGDGNVVYVSSFRHPFYRILFTRTTEIPKDLVFTDEIDPASGLERDEPATYSAGEFAAMLEEGGKPDFASDNVYVTFDADGELQTVERFYVPWQ